MATRRRLAPPSYPDPAATAYPYLSPFPKPGATGPHAFSGAPPSTATASPHLSPYPKPMPPPATAPAAAAPASFPAYMPGALRPLRPLPGYGRTRPPGAPSAMTMLVGRGMDMLREYAPQIAQVAQSAYGGARILPIAPPGTPLGDREAALRTFGAALRTELETGIAAGRSMTQIRASLMDDIAALRAAFPRWNRMPRSRRQRV